MSDQPTVQINNPPAHSNDHDLLLTLKAEVTTKLDRVIADVKDLKDDIASRVSDLENEKLSKEEFDTFKTQNEATRTDHEDRIRSNTNWIQYGLGFAAAIDFILIVYQIYVSTHP
jgi:hypothetical protein